MAFGVGSRRAVLDGLARILDAAGLEELFSAPDDEALFLYHLLADVARARGSQYYWEICRTARRRGVTPEYVADRASVLVASIEERRRTDIYRILGVPALASEDTIRHRWHEVAKRAHPDVGGDASEFRQVKEAYEILREPARRAEYERFWLRAVGPIARLMEGEDGVPPFPGPAAPLRAQSERRVVMVAKRTAPAPADPVSESVRAVHGAAARFADAGGEIDRRLDAMGLEGMRGVRALLAHVERALAPVGADDLARLRAEVDANVARLEAVAADLATVADLKRRLGA